MASAMRMWRPDDADSFGKTRCGNDSFSDHSSPTAAKSTVTRAEAQLVRARGWSPAGELSGRLDGTDIVGRPITRHGNLGDRRSSRSFFVVVSNAFGTATSSNTPSCWRRPRAAGFRFGPRPAAVTVGRWNWRCRDEAGGIYVTGFLRAVGRFHRNMARGSAAGHHGISAICYRQIRQQGFARLDSLRRKRVGKTRGEGCVDRSGNVYVHRSSLALSLGEGFNWEHDSHQYDRSPPNTIPLEICFGPSRRAAAGSLSTTREICYLAGKYQTRDGDRRHDPDQPRRLLASMTATRIRSGRGNLPEHNSASGDHGRPASMRLPDRSVPGHRRV